MVHVCHAGTVSLGATRMGRRRVLRLRADGQSELDQASRAGIERSGLCCRRTQLFVGGPDILMPLRKIARGRRQVRLLDLPFMTIPLPDC
jgi:hypothetical protein